MKRLISLGSAVFMTASLALTGCGSQGTPKDTAGSTTGSKAVTSTAVSSEPIKDKLIMGRMDNYAKDGKYYGIDYHVGA